MVMVMKNMFNIPMSCGLMIPILQLGHCCNFFELWKKLQLVHPKCCLGISPKHMLPMSFAKQISLYNSIKNTKWKCGPQIVVKFFWLQMDNYVKDNTNRYLLAFLSLLMTRKVFKEVETPCGWSYTWKYWWMLWIFVQKVEKEKIILCQIWWRFSWSRKRYFSFYSWFKKF
jgi:hypothetical protein